MKWGSMPPRETVAIDPEFVETQCPSRGPGLTHVGLPRCEECGVATTRLVRKSPTTSCPARKGDYPHVRSSGDRCLFCSVHMPTIDDTVSNLRAVIKVNDEKLRAGELDDKLVPFEDFTDRQQNHLKAQKFIWAKKTELDR